MNDDLINIGEKIRALRKMRNLSLKSLSKAIGMSYSYLSGLENGKYSISLDKLQKIAKYFKVDIIYFMQNNHKHTTFIGEKDGVIINTEDGVVFRILTAENTKNLQVTHVELPPNSPSSRNIHYHNVEGEEYIFVLEGRLYVMVSGELYKLEPGQSVFYNISVEHFMYTESKSAKFLMIVSPPYDVAEDIK